jgi:Phage tail lysozyme
MAISPQKLLPQSGATGIKLSSSIVKTSNLSNIRARTPNIENETSTPGGKLVAIYESLVNINDILNKRSKDDKEQVIQKKQQEDKKEKKQEEDKLELKNKKQKIDLPKVQNPFASFFDRLKNALVLLFVGWLVNRFFDYIPKILEGVSNFMKTLEDIRKFLKPATDALGSALYNVTLAGTKMLGAITGAQIDQNEKNLAVAINELDKKFSIVNALMTGIIIGDIFSAVADGLDLFERPGKTPSVDPKKVPKGVQQRYFQRFGRNAFIRKFGEEAIENLPRNMQRTAIQRGARNVGAMALRGARNVFGRGAVRIAGKVFGRIPIIGGLIDFVINLAMGEKPGRAAAKAIGATVGAGLGTLIPIPFAGTILGGFLGDLLGGAVYDMFAPKDTQKKKGPKKKTEKPKGYFFGGLVSGVRNFFSGKSTRVSKPSSGTGLSQKLVQQTPTYSQSIKPLSVDPNLVDKIGAEVLKGFVGVSNALSSAPFVGPFVALGINLALGKERFNKSTALSVAAGIGNLLGNPLAIGIYNFLNKAMPGLGNLVQKVVGKNFGEFLSGWITQFLGMELYNQIYPMIDFIKNIMSVAQVESQEAAKKPNAGDVKPVNVPAGKDDKIRAAVAFYKSKGFSDTGAAYMVGNLLQESGLRPDAVGDNGKAFGLAQWRIDAAAGARWLAYQKWANQNNKQIGDFYAQLEYTIVEGQKYNAGLTMMKGNDREAHKSFVKGYEGYSVEGDRFGFAEDILKNAEKYGLGRKNKPGGGKIIETNLKPVKIKPSKPQSMSAMSYPRVSQFASYDKPSTIVQPIRQVVYVPMPQQQSGGVVMVGSGGVNNTDYQIAAIKAAL